MSVLPLLILAYGTLQFMTMRRVSFRHGWSQLATECGLLMALCFCGFLFLASVALLRGAS